MRRPFKLLLVLGVLGAVAAAIKALLDQQRGSNVPAPTSSGPAGRPGPVPAPAPPTPAPTEVDEAEAPGAEDSAWREPTASGGCPNGFPVKAKLSSKIFHVPGGASYERTTPDRCYRDASAAEADGLRQAKR